MEDQEKVEFGEIQIVEDTEMHKVIKPKKQCCNATPYVLMIALSVHAAFEGLALGLQTQMIDVLNIVLAIGIHKGAAASALGISLVKNFPNDFGLVRKLLFVFSMATPIGIIIGMSVVHSIRLNDKPKPRPFRPISDEQFERQQNPVLKKYGRLILK